MSLNSDKEIMGVGGITGGAHQAPRLAAGGIGYAAWRPNMDVFLQRNGAEGIHQKPLTEAKWLEMSRRSEAWNQEALDAALALVLGGDFDDASSVPLPEEKHSDAVQAGRKLVSITVERSRRVFGVLYSSLPEELRAQTGHIAPGWAYGLWHWLETKFQSTGQRWGTARALVCAAAGRGSVLRCVSR